MQSSWLLHRKRLSIWEGRRPPRRSVLSRKAVRVLWVVSGIGLVLVIALREQERLGVRQTRAVLLDARGAVDAYMAEHDGACPADLRVAATLGGITTPPLDAWGRPLGLRCPGTRAELAYQLWSDGPDGEPGGLDRIE